MNIQLNPSQSDTKAGPIAVLSAVDLTGKENRLVSIVNAGGIAKAALPAAITSLALFVLASGDVVGQDNWIEQPSPGGNFRVKLNGTCNPGDVLVLCDPTASAGVNAGKVEAVGATAGVYFSIGIAEEKGVDEQDVLARYLPRLHSVKATFTGAAPAATGSSNSSPYGFTTSAQADALVATVRDIRTQLIALGLMQ